MAEPITVKQPIRDALVNDLVEAISNQLKSTLYHLVEIDDKSKPTALIDLILNEIDVLYLDDVATKYELNDAEYCQLHDIIVDLIRTHHCVMTSQRYAGTGSTIFRIHAVVFTPAQVGPVSHPCTRMSVTAGCGEVIWDAYSSGEQTDMIEFAYNLIDRVGLSHKQSDIVVNELRYTVQFDLKEMANV